MAIGQQAEYHDITLPDGWTWERVHKERAEWALGPEMVPVVTAPGVIGWITITALRADQAADRVPSGISAQATVGFSVPAVVSPKMIADLITTFIESGDPVTHGWVLSVRRESPEPRKQGIWYSLPEFFADPDFKIAVYEDIDEDGEVEEDDDGNVTNGKKHIIGKAEIIKGLTLLASGHKGAYAIHLSDILSDNHDAATADIFMQMVVFGKEVYA